jgi:hypothetical protein
MKWSRETISPTSTGTSSVRGGESYTWHRFTDSVGVGIRSGSTLHLGFGWTIAAGRPLADAAQTRLYSKAPHSTRVPL